MANIYSGVEELIGSTPLLRLDRYGKAHAFTSTVLAKLEYLNPAGSAKDRVGLSLIDDAEARGLLSPGGTIIEPTSGNTGIGLACVAAARGYHMILTMPDTMSAERRAMLAAYGAKLVLTPGALGMKGAIDKANELAASIPGSFIPGQFDNPANPAAHYRTTGPEIWADTDGKVDIFVATVGTGGTLSGTARYLKEQNPAIQVVAVEPDASPLLSGGVSGPHGIQGIGANFIPDNLDRTVYDRVIRVRDEDAFRTGRELVRTEGVLVGISSGAALFAAEQLAREEENRGKTIVVLLPDSGDRYLSSPMFAQEDEPQVRTASMDDLEDVTAVEALCFPPAEAATREDFRGRLAAYAGHFWLLYAGDRLVAFVNGMVTDEPDLRDEMYSDASLHDEKWAWQMIFGVNTIPEFRRRGYAELLLRRAIDDARAQGRKGLVLTCKDALVHYYAKLGFVSEGVSKSVHGGVVWYQMRLTF